MSSSCRSAFGAAGLVLAAAQASAAANWEFQPRIELRALHDDNYRLSDVPGTEIEVTGGFVDAELAFRSQGPVAMFEILPRVRSSLFPDEQTEESTDYFFGVGWQRNTPRLDTRIKANYANESVVTSELLSAEFPDVELGDEVVGDSGRVSVRNRRDLVSFAPTLAYRWTPRHRIEATFTYLDASFDETVVEQTDFTDMMATAGVAVDLSQRDTFAARLRGGVYEPENARDDTQRYGVEAEWNRRWSHITRFYVRAGVDSVETTVVTLDPRRRPVSASVSDTAVVGGIGAAWTYEVTQVVVDAVRSVSPSSSGVVVNRDELRLRMRRDLSARLAITGNVRSVRTEGSVEDVAAVRDRDYLTGRAGIEWRMSRQMTLLGAYDYAWQEFEGEPTDATSNAVSLSFIYEPRRRD